MAIRLILANSPRVRYASGSVMYFAQGVPYGLLHIALPAWLASQGVGAGQIASFLAVIILPWAFKLLSGPLMDRYQYLPMGRRRPWVLGAQLGLALSFFGLVFVEQPAEQMGLLMLLGVLINIFAATQDVAVDGMSIDLTPVGEQGRLNAFMAFGKSVGWGITSAVSGILLVTFGLGVTAMVAAAVMGAIFLAFVLVLERDGERSLPWSRGEAVSARRPAGSLLDLLRDLNAVLWLRASLILMIIVFFEGLVSGYGKALMPIAAVNLFGYTTPQWSQLVAIMGLTGAAVALGFGPLIDRFGAKRMMFLTFALVAAHAFLLAQTQYLWEDSTYVKVMLSIWIMLTPVTMVCMIALAMAICGSVNSATQFAIYMSLANLGSSAGSKTYGMVAERASYVQAYILLGMLTVALIVALLFHRHRRLHTHGAAPATTRQYTVGMSTSEAGMYWSGAMRCPKCRADMEQILIEGIWIDRCRSCQGLWFDAGEAGKLRNRKAASAIDIGDALTGKQQNAIDRYPCPRCGGPMTRMVDPQQTHIWYETCGSCHGSFFDAGEFIDLSTHSASDLFKRLVMPERR